MSNTPPNVYLYVPNIMDYLRAACLFVSFYYAKTSPKFFIILYFFSFFLDAVDGKAARYFNQTSKYGATLDMVIDRIGTSGLLMVLSNFYPDYSTYFIYLMMLDIGSHWLQTHSGFLDPNNLNAGKVNDNHKNLEEKFWILNFYYKTTVGLLTVCLGAELFLLMLYFLHFDKNLMQNDIFVWGLYINFGIYVFKQIVSVIQIISASDRMTSYDQKEYMLRQKTN